MLNINTSKVKKLENDSIGSAARIIPSFVQCPMRSGSDRSRGGPGCTTWNGAPYLLPAKQTTQYTLDVIVQQ